MTAAVEGQQQVVIAVTVVATLVIVALVASLWSALRAGRRVRAAAEALERDVRAVLQSVDGTLAHANAELERVDGLIGSAEQLTNTVGTASRMAYASLASPVIKVMAFSRGTSQASRRLRGRDRQLRARQLRTRRR